MSTGFFCVHLNNWVFGNEKLISAPGERLRGAGGEAKVEAAVQRRKDFRALV
ncbi:hypothetical protein [Bacillus sp. P14.5]|uniref:hypothetical protein n=1 Tax=Bacillus sp. P14.5 TaxID=1983400 RepID=UPI0013B068C8|nr:hypothetical protein [Bacillus sp. P14.5]